MRCSPGDEAMGGKTRCGASSMRRSDEEDDEESASHGGNPPERRRILRGDGGAVCRGVEDSVVEAAHAAVEAPTSNRGPIDDADIPPRSATPLSGSEATAEGKQDDIPF